MEKVHVYITGYRREIEIGKDGSTRTLMVAEANIPADPSGIDYDRQEEAALVVALVAYWKRHAAAIDGIRIVSTRSYARATGQDP